MSGETTADLQDLIERLKNGDDSARRALLERVYHRLRRISAAVFEREFPRLRAGHDLDSVVDEAWAQLNKALETTRPATVEGFYDLVFRKVRHALMDMARRQQRHDRDRQQELPGPDESDAENLAALNDTTYEPSRLAFWTEFHQEVESLPDSQRAVFQFHYFAEFPQAEIARLLDLPPKRVSRLWIAATIRLAERLHGLEELL